MSRDYRDQRGGHKQRHFNTYTCRCCAVVSPEEKSRQRCRRERASRQFEEQAEGKEEIDE